MDMETLELLEMMDLTVRSGAAAVVAVREAPVILGPMV
jgi:hypothetical protein